MPVSMLWGKLLNVNLFTKTELTQGLLIATNNQLLYLLICILALIKAPTLILPIYAIIYGAHLLPYGFLYSSKAYKFNSFSSCALVMIGLVFLRLDVIFIPIVIEISVILLAIGLIKELRAPKEARI